MAYIENFTSKLDWAMPFQRTGKFPLDRSTIFSSYEDALLYAGQGQYSITKSDGTVVTKDSRELGGTSYIGQIVAVYGNNEVGTAEEVAAYIITAVGASASLMKLAQTTATGDFATDIQNLQTSLSDLESRVKTVEDLVKTIKDTNTTYTFSEGSADGTIHVIASDGSEADVPVKGWGGLVETANGRTKAYVYQNKSDEVYLADIKSQDKFKLGDLIYFRDANVSDQWVSAVRESAVDGIWYELTDLETDHPDLTGFLTSTDAENIYAKKSDLTSKADVSTVNDLAQTVTDNKSASDQAFEAVNEKLGTVKTGNDGKVISLQSQIDNIDVTGQITAKINELDVNKVGGATGSYITSIEQIDGKIVANAATLDDYNAYTDEKVEDALKEAKSYVDTKIGTIPEGSSDVIDYVDSKIETEINAVNTNINTNIVSKLSGLETTVGGHTTKIGEIETTIGGHTTKIGNLETEVGNVKTRVGTLETDVSGLKEDIKNAGKVDSVKIHYKDNNNNVYVESIQPDENKVLNFANGISTDWLTQGKHVLVLDCGNANQ